MSIRDGLAEHSMTLTVAILSTTALNVSNVLRNEEILSASLTVGAAFWTGKATALISEMAVFGASWAASAVGMPEVSGWSNEVSWA